MHFRTLVILAQLGKLLFPQRRDLNFGLVVGDFREQILALFLRPRDFTIQHHQPPVAGKLGRRVVENRQLRQSLPHQSQPVAGMSHIGVLFGVAGA